MASYVHLRTPIPTHSLGHCDPLYLLPHLCNAARLPSSGSGMGYDSFAPSSEMRELWVDDLPPLNENSECRGDFRTEVLLRLPRQ